MNRIISTFTVSLALLLTAPSSAQNTSALTLEQTSVLRCSAAFALVADGQARGNEAALAYPPLTTRGREFFVRSSAKLMDETGMDRAAIAALLAKEAQDIWDKGTLDQMMPSCLLMLASSGI